jgi:rhodanese-related sulfurtransferase
MKKILRIELIIFGVSCLLLLNGCLKDTSTPPASGFSSSAEFLSFIELNRYVLNQDVNPSSISVDEVYSNMNNYLLIDIRERPLFINGHIEGVKNILPADLPDSLKKWDLSRYAKIVIIGKTGQDGAYVTCLLRILGVSNVFYMDFGMAYWNRIFSDDWINARKNYSVRNFNSFAYKKGIFYALPEINFPNNSSSMNDKIKDRISLLLKEEYDLLGISLKDAYNNYFDYGLNQFSGCYMICYGPDFLYTGGDISMYGKAGHPASSVYYNPQADIKSTTYLQTIPSDRPVIIYSLNGQQGAFLMAYLRLLGYDARNINFGCWTMWGAGFLTSAPNPKGVVVYSKNEFTDFGFWANDKFGAGVSYVRNYPFVTGE